MSAILEQLNTQASSEPQVTDLIWYSNKNTYQRDQQGRLIGLNLCGQQLTDRQAQTIFEEEDLSALQSLNLSENALTELVIPAEAALLRHIIVSENSSLKRFSFEGALPLLETLHASECAIERFELPDGMENLRVLDMRKNKLAEVTIGGNCPQLQSLHVGSNELTRFSLPAGFGELLYLYLLDNQIEEVIIHSNLPKIHTLHLRNNQLQKLPGNLLFFENLETLYLHNNPLPDIPKASISNDERGNSWSGVKSFLQEAKKGTIINDRVKIIIVGNGRVGKTSLFKRLKDIPFNKKEKYTHGVQLGMLEKDNLPDVKTASLQANVWDFGGQEIFYATHQFFLSEEALYILAWTDEENVKEHRERDKEILPFDEIWRSREYWLENIRLHGKNSPVLMVQTHCDQKTIPLNQESYNQKPYFAECLDFSAAKDYGLPKLKDVISSRLNQAIPFLGKEFPITYDSVIQEIEKERKTNPTITLDKFYLICSLGDIDKGGEDELLAFLNRAGIVVYFDVPQLKEVVYIDPDWLTNQVYSLINNDLKAFKGRITPAYLEKIFLKYTPIEREQFLELLQRFELIFEEENDSETVYIAPQYLPDKLEGEARIFFESYLEDMKHAFTFRFSKFMPDNVMINFVSRYGPSSRKIYWKHGLFLRSSTGAKGIVRYEEKKKSLHVFTNATESQGAFQQEILQTFIKLSKNADAELSLDGQVFVSWQELQNQQKLGNKNMLAIDGETKVAIQDFEVLQGMGQHQESFRGARKIQQLKEENSSAQPQEVKIISQSTIPSSTKIPSKTKILYIAANPTNESRLQTDKEHRVLKAVFERGKMREKFEFLPSQFAVTITELIKALNAKPEIVHFSGHGGRKGIYITDENNNAQQLNAAALKRIFSRLTGATRFVLLNACLTAENAREISNFGMYVVGNNMPISDKGAISFSKGLYNGLGEGKDFREAYDDAIITVLADSPQDAEVIEVWKDGKKLAW